MPLLVGSLVRLGKEVARFLNDLGDVACPDCRMCKAFVRTNRQELSHAFYLVARIHYRTLISVERSEKRGFMPVLDRAV